MYRLMLYYLRFLVGAVFVLSLVHWLPYSPWQILLTAAYLVIVCYAFNRAGAAIVRTKPNPESPIITALILTLIAGPFVLPRDLVFLSILAAVAMMSKYLVVYRGRHIFNPAAFAVLISALFLGRGASWWIGNQMAVVFVCFGGIFIIRKIKRFHLVLAFLIAYLGLEGILALLGQGTIPGVLTMWKNLLLLSPILFFSMVMLVEPLTGPQDRRLRIYYGIFIAALAVGLQKFAPALPYGLELSLLIGNLATRIAAPDFRLALKFRDAQKIAANTYGFWFNPDRSFDFQPGQYLEWTLPHPHPDNRGIRRYFTIASAPSEKGILLATRMAEKSSSFKTALLHLKPGDEIVVSGREGDFVLPQDPEKKMVFIAGGIGITPFRSMIRYLADRGTQRPIILLYSNKTAPDIAFGKLFDEAASRVNLRTVYTLTDAATAPAGWQGRTGYIDEAFIKSAVPDWQDRLFYVSGPEPMVEAFQKMLLGIGISKTNLKTDDFPGYTETHQA